MSAAESLPPPLTAQRILAALRALERGDFSARLPDDLGGIEGDICEAFNNVATIADDMRSSMLGLRQSVGRDGHLSKRLLLSLGRGGWGHCVGAVNDLLDDVTEHTEQIARVVSAVGRGDLSQVVDLAVEEGPLRGDFLRHAREVNGTVQRLAGFVSEVTRVAQEVGVEGKLGAQARIEGISGEWRQLTDAVNSMASHLTSQVREIARITTAVAQGDLTKTVDIEARGEILELKETINTMVDQLSSFASEVTRVAREVGSEGRLGGQAQVRGVSGIWRDLTENVNSMAHNLTSQVRNIAEVAGAIADGDLSKKITVPVQGEILELKNTINGLVDRLGAFTAEVTRVAREVGTDGVLGGQADVTGLSGIWRELSESVNFMAHNLTSQVRNIAEVITALAEGDLSHKITVDAQGEILTLKSTINTTVDKIKRFTDEVTRVARLVGTEGTLGVQADVRDVSGVWKELTDNVNLMGRNLTDQVRDIAEVTTAVANGDLSRKITVEVKGEILALKNTINAMVDSLSSFASEVTRVAREVGTDGVLGGQAQVRGVSGIWAELTDNVNSMATRLTDQVRNISEVATAIANGDLQRKIVVDAKGEILELKDTINTMVDQLGAFAEQVTRVAREVGTEGKLGGQASVEGVRGIWKELTDNVNLMASNLTNQVRDIAQVSTAIANGMLDRKVTVEVQGEMLDLKKTINTMVDQLDSFAAEVTRVARDVGVEGMLGGQADVRGVSGIWKELTDNVNLMASNLTNQVRDIARVTTAVANGDLSRKITVEVRGEILELKDTINTMVDQLSSFASEVTRVAGEVGTEGILGGQAQVKGVSGTWRELTDNTNIMARNLTEQVRGIARVVTAAANGDLKQKLTLDAKGEIATLVETINNMLVTLSTFADQVTGVARDVGVEGRLGGQADVPGAAGIWRDLTNNVNELAGNLTRQMRAIGDVATAVTKGDLTQLITVDARGEVALLKDNVNKMILTLAETTRQNQEQDWLKTNLTRFTRMLQGQRDLLSVAQQVLSELAPVVDAQYGVFYMAVRNDEALELRLFATYAVLEEDRRAREVFAIGESLVGQAAADRKRILVWDVPSGYVRLGSGLDAGAPCHVVVVPIMFEGDVKGVIELASIHRFTPIQLDFLEQLLESLGIVVATIEATMRTDELLRQSQRLARELTLQQEELRQTNEELEEKARQLIEQKGEVERKNLEVGLAKQELEEKAHQLALTSRYKSQFLANMSHELRTPLNGLLILSKQLAGNPKGTLTEREVEYARTIYQSGADLLTLINEILDLAKIESGTMATEVSEVVFRDLREYVERSFRHVAEEKRLRFEIQLSGELPETMQTDEGRLRQVLRNLLANAFKFTEHGEVTLSIFPSTRSTASGDREKTVSFRVADTGIGIPEDKQLVIFEAFQQADGSTSRKYGGTGLGLAISREIAGLLRGDLLVESRAGEGSAFTLQLPFSYSPPQRTSERGRSALSAASAWTSRDADALSEPRTEHAAPAPSEAVVQLLQDKTILIADDDVRNIFALTAALEQYGVRVLYAENGYEALEALAEHPDIDAVLMDIMMPELDGYEAMKRLRAMEAFRELPVIALTAQAMKGDREKCLAAGASDYVAKPVDPDGLVALLAHWLTKRGVHPAASEGAAPEGSD